MTDKRYLVATDLSSASRNAADFVASMARATGAGIDLFCAVPRALGEGVEEVLQRAQLQLAEMAAIYVEQGRTCWVNVVVADGVAAAIADHARRTKADLVCVAPQGLTGWKRLVLGSVTERLLRAGLPEILVVRNGRRPIAHVLVGVDRSAESRVALHRAAEIAKASNAKLLIIEAAAIPGVIADVERALRADSSRDLEVDRRLTAYSQLQRWVAEQDLEGIDVESDVRMGSPAEMLLAEAEARGSTMIVLGTYGKSRLEEFFVGSISRAVATAAPIPVLLVRKSAGDGSD